VHAPGPAWAPGSGGCDASLSISKPDRISLFATDLQKQPTAI
jgi:hypothetical protein